MNVVDVAAGRVLVDRRVTIMGGRIISVARAPDDALGRTPSGRVLTLRGKYVIPGLWDMHVHIDTTEQWFFPLAVAAGVTGVRDMGGRLERAMTWKPQIGARDTLRPMVIAAGPIVTGAVDDPDPRVVRVSTVDQAPTVVDSLLAGGASFVKVHDWLAPDVYRALAARAAARGSYVAGHLPFTVDPTEAELVRQRSIEHLGNGWGLLSLHASRDAALVDSMRLWMTTSRGPAELVRHFTAAWYGRTADAFDSARATTLGRQLARGGVWVTPTLNFSYRLQHASLDSTVVTDPRLEYLPGSVRALLPYVVPAERLQLTPDTAAAVRFFRVQQTLTRILAREGVGLLAGTDAGPYAPMIPGFSLHDELVQLVEAGLTPLAALRAATNHPARFLGLADSVGAVANGYRADLVVLDANPLEDIRNVARVHAVLVAGHLLSSVERERLLQRLRGQFRHDTS